ncbi:hypothetical protein M885DRAFT_519603 [Pelagophyceae sp. CCMP2097]|nr:hypothetical protein M885DRAFT_519603 [Pelagophyceae sp. CCMP2097]|mmetsp:Transcript_22561/g.76270  ORF Transcript_22561/g.76270 Transcript_22561/m.76270 type:complete len:140 (-) Transcript_22561:88-507(-)
MAPLRFLAVLAALVPIAAASCDICRDDLYSGSCGAFSEETSKWSDYDTLSSLFTQNCERTCCASSSKDCCQPHAGVIAGTVVGILVGFALLLLFCCATCGCCPASDRLCCDGGCCCKGGNKGAALETAAHNSAGAAHKV